MIHFEQKYLETVSEKIAIQLLKGNLQIHFKILIEILHGQKFANCDQNFSDQVELNQNLIFESQLKYRSLEFQTPKMFQWTQF